MTAGAITLIVAILSAIIGLVIGNYFQLEDYDTLEDITNLGLELTGNHLK